MSNTILITGASSGIGRAAAQIFSKRGWNVIATMPDVANGDDWAARENVVVTRLDVRDEASIAASISEGKQRFGRIDALLSNAGYGQYGIFETIPKSRIQDQFDVNLFGAMNVLRAILPEFRANSGGTVLVTSSSGGIYGLPTMAIYITTKFAIEGFFESVSYELASQNIRVKLIEPGGVNTAFHKKAAGITTKSGEIATYREFYDQVAAVVQEKIDSHALTSAEQVAGAIFAAATDGTDRLRYIVGRDAAAIIEARRSGPEGEFMHLVRAEFGLDNNPDRHGQSSAMR